MPQTLLLADDSVTIQRVIELTFADEAIKVVAVSDGDQAIGRIEADPPDIVLVDISMPGRTGYEVAQHIKQSPRLKHIPVLLLAGAFEPVDQAKATAVGCDGVLAKPFEPQLVIARVKELLERGRGAPSSSAVADESPAPTLPPGPAGQPGESWALLRAEPTGACPQSAQVARLDSYFDRLDAAFQTLGDKAPSGPPLNLPLSPAPPAQPPEPERPLADWGRPELTEGPKPDAGATAPTFAAEPALVTAAAAPAQPFTLPPLADAFAAILAAERHESMPAFAPAWATPPSAPSNGAGALSEDAIEEIARRVLGRLSAHVVRETVADVTSGIAERLVREEIERIRSSIK